MHAASEPPGHAGEGGAGGEGGEGGVGVGVGGVGVGVGDRPSIRMFLNTAVVLFRSQRWYCAF